MLLTLLYFISQLLFSGNLNSQEIINDEVNPKSIEIRLVDEPLSITRRKMIESRSIIDIYPYYKSSWVEKYLDVKISFDGTTPNILAVGKDSIFNNQQKELLSSIKGPGMLSFEIRYIPKNTLEAKEEKLLTFEVKVAPDLNAAAKSMDDYLNKSLDFSNLKSLMNKMNKNALGIIQFTIDTNGEVVDPLVISDTGNQSLDLEMMHLVCSMPHWSAARFGTGIYVKQKMALVIGNTESCTMNMLNMKSILWSDND